MIDSFEFSVIVLSNHPIKEKILYSAFVALRQPLVSASNEISSLPACLLFKKINSLRSLHFP
jgi:hypothetical protein